MNSFVCKRILYLFAVFIGLHFFIACSGGSGQEGFDDNLMNQNENDNSSSESDSEGENENINLADNNLDQDLGNIEQNLDVNNEDNNLLNNLNQNYNMEENPTQEEVVEVASDVEAEMGLASGDGERVQSLSKGLAGDPSGVGLPEMGSKMPYIVRQGDSLSKIAHRIFGEMKEWHKMAELSDLENPNVIYPGDIVYYQLTEKSLAYAQEQASKEENQVAVVVQPGDSLSKIAKEYYGSASLWTDIWQGNSQITMPDQIKVGTTIYLKKAERIKEHKVPYNLAKNTLKAKVLI